MEQQPVRDSGPQSSCCCTFYPTHRVAPAERAPPGCEMVQTFSGRVLCVRRLNPSPRDPRLESQMQAFMSQEYCKPPHRNGKVAAVDDGERDSSSFDTPQHSRSSRLARTKSAGPMRSRNFGQDSMDLSSPSKGSNSSPQHVADDHTAQHHVAEDHTTRPGRENVRTATGVQVSVDAKKQAWKDTCDSASDDDIEEVDLEHAKPKPSCGVVVFMLHGVAGSSDVWKAQLDYFGQQGYEVVAPDLLGHGCSSASPEPAAYLFKNIAKDILFIFDKYCKDKNVLIGHSYGGSFASYVARERASWVTHLVLISGGSPTPLAPQPGIFHWSVCCLAGCKPLLRKTFSRNAFHAGSLSPAPRQAAFEVPSYVLKYMMNGQVWPEGSYEYHGLIYAPTLILHGQHDGLISLQEEQEMASAIYGSELIVIDKASHMVMMEQPNVVNQHILNFLNQAET